MVEIGRQVPALRPHIVAADGSPAASCRRPRGWGAMSQPMGTGTVLLKG